MPLGSRRNLATASEVEHAVVVDAQMHDFGVAVAAVAARKIPVFAVGLANDLNRSHRLGADRDVDVVDEEVASRQDLVDVASDDWDLRIADDVTRRSPLPCDGREARVGKASGAVGHTFLLSYSRRAAYPSADAGGGSEAGSVGLEVWGA